MKIKKFVSFCGRIPRGYGLSYIPVGMYGGVYYPFPLNWIVAPFYWVWVKVRHVPIGKNRLKVYGKNAKEGYDEGFEKGMKAAAFRIQQIEEQLGRCIKKVSNNEV